MCGQLLRLRRLGEILDAPRVVLAMSVAGNWIGATGAFDEDVRPEHPGLHVHRGNLRQMHAHLVLGEPTRLAADDRGVVHLDDGGEQTVPPSPPAGRESFAGHDPMLPRSRHRLRGSVRLPARGEQWKLRHYSWS